MTSRARSAATLLVLTALLVAGAAYGWTALTAPLPRTTEVPQEPCIEEQVDKGDKVRPGQVLVSVLNAGTTNGLAGRTMTLFVEAGFGEGTEGNAPEGTEVARAEIWVEDLRNPGARLVATRLGRNVEIVKRSTGEPGVVVVVGDKFEKLRKGRPSITVQRPGTICRPTPEQDVVEEVAAG